MARVLIMPVGIGLAHIGRTIMIGRELSRQGVEVLFGTGNDALAILKNERFPYYQLPEFNREAYEKKLKHNDPRVYTRKLLERFVAAELRLYKKIQPDLVMYDARLSAKVSAKIAGIPTVSITNADVTPYYDFSKVKIPVGTLVNKIRSKRIISLLEKKHSQRLLSHIFPSIAKAVLLAEIIKLSPSLMKMGFDFTTNPYDFVLGDLTLLIDIPQFRPVIALPDTVKMVGPVFWDGGPVKSPAQETLHGEHMIYVTASGTGDKDIFIKTLEYLQELDRPVVATTGNTLSPDEVTVSYPNLHVTNYLSGNWIMRQADLVIFPGGNSTAYQALYNGVPQVCLPLHLDQEDNSNQLERLGTGEMINPYVRFTKDEFLRTVKQVLENKKYRENSLRLKEVMRHYDGEKAAVREIIRFLNAPAQTARIALHSVKVS